MRKVILLAAALVSSAVATRVEAATWLTPGVGCAVDPLDVGLAQHVNGYVEFRVSLTGDILLYCPITAGQGGIEGTGWTLDLYYRDSTINNDQNFVRVDLQRLDLTNGAISSVPGCEFINSDGAVAPGYNILNNSCTESFNPNRYAYLAKVTIKRSSSFQTMRFYGLSLYQ